MKKSFYLFLSVFIILLSFTACEDATETEVTDPIDTDIKTSLNGKWKSTGSGLILEISGTNATIINLGSGTFADAAALGYVKLGDLCMKEIVQVNSTTWSYRQLQAVTTNGVVNRIEWTNQKGTMTLSNDSNTITTTITGNNSTPFESRYTRVQ